MQKKKKLSAKILSIALSAAMVLTMMPATVFAAEGDTAPKAPSGLECHVAHDENCGYKEAVEGVDCSHKNEDGTYSCTSDTVSDNTATPSNADKTVCTHEDGCGYTEAIQGAPCNHTCEKCEVKDSGEAEKQPEQEQCSYDKVVELFTALPEVSVITTDTTEQEKEAIIAQLTKATDAYAALNEVDKARFDTEQETLLAMVMQLNSVLFGLAPMVLLNSGDALNLGTLDPETKTFKDATGSGTGKYQSIVVGFTLSQVDAAEGITIPDSVNGYTYQSAISSAYGHIITVDGEGGKTPNEIATEYLSKIVFNGGAAGQSVAITLSFDRLEYKTFSWGGNGHFYQYVPFKGSGSDNTWLAAYDKAKTMTYNGRKGYLATVTSLEEDLFVREASGSIGWLGGTRMALKDGKTNEELVKTGKANDLFKPMVNESYEGEYWYWACGPEAGERFYDKKSTSPDTFVNDHQQNKENGYYFNWETAGSIKEPNSGTKEAALATLLLDGGGGYQTGLGYSWNDLDPMSTGINSNWDSKGFFVEYGNLKDGDSGSSSESESGGIGGGADIEAPFPQWLTDAGLSKDQVNYAGRPSATVQLSSEATLTKPIELPAGSAVTIDLNGKTLTAAPDQPAIQAAAGGKVEFTLKDSTSTPDSPSPTLVGGNGQPAIDFSDATEGSKVTLSDGASVKGGDGGSANSNGGDGITGSANTEIVMVSGSAATGGSGGAGGKGGNGVTGGIVIIDGNATGGTGGENTAGKGGDGGIGASGNKITGNGGTATGGNGGGGSEGNGSGGKGTSQNPEAGSNLAVTPGKVGSLNKTPIVISGLKAPDSPKVYDGNPIANTVFGTATFDNGWSGELEYTYYSGSTATGTPLVSNPTNAGTYTVVAGIPATDGKFSGKHAAIKFTIDAKTVNVTDGALEVKKPYDGTADAGTATGKLGLIGVETADTNNVLVKIGVGAYADSNMGKNKTVTLTISLEGTAASNYTLGSATYSFAKAEITKATYTGTPANAPDSTPENKGDKSITIKPVTPPDGEKVEYAVSKSKTAPTLDSEWQTSTTFDKLAPNTEYYFFARVTENDKHAPGGESQGTSITTDKSEYTGKFNKPDGTPESRSHNSITLKTVNHPDGESLEYGIDKANDGTIIWQDGTTFDSLSLNTKYKFYTRVKENNTHKAGTASDATIIRTKKEPTTVSGNVKDSGGAEVGSATVTLTPSRPVITATTDSSGNYNFENVPEGVYNLVVTTGTGENQITFTETVIVAGTPISGKEIQLLDGKKSTVVVSKNNAPKISAGGVNELLNDTHIDKTLNTKEKTAVDGGGSVELKVKADIKADADVAVDKGEIENIANGQTIDLLLDLSVTKIVKDSTGKTVTGDGKITTLANIIKIHISIPADLQGKDGLRLYRVHDGKAELLQKDYPDANGEYYTIDDSGELMTAHVKNFSTYAMGYNKSTVIVPGGGGGGSSSSNYYYIKATAGPGGSMSTAEKVKVRAGESASFTITPDKGYQIEDVLVNGKSIGAKNTYEFTKVYSDQTIHATFKKVGDNNPQTGVSFKDVKENDWCYDAIMKATAKGWFSGTSATTFSPNAPTTRGMIAAILHRIEGTPKANVASFNDVAADAYYYANGVAWAEANNIVRGYGNGSYGPNDNITREQLASILYRYASHKGYDVSKTATLDSFTDSKSVSGYAKESMSWAVGSGLISDRGNNALAPTATATRAEVAVILVRFDELFIK